MPQVWARESVHRKDKINHGIPMNGMFTLCEEKNMKYETLIKTFCKICMYGTGAGSFISFYQFFYFFIFSLLLLLLLGSITSDHRTHMTPLGKWKALTKCVNSAFSTRGPKKRDVSNSCLSYKHPYHSYPPTQLGN